MARPERRSNAKQPTRPNREAGRAGEGGARETSVERPTISRGVRIAVSILLVLHMVAVFSAPWAMGPPARLATAVRWFFSPYLEATTLGDHGYRFFAPDPGESSHLVKYQLEMPDGSMPPAKVFPNLAEHRPRLLYHRHFMLTEFLNSAYVPQRAIDEEQDPEAKAAMRAQRERMLRLAESYARHLQATSGSQHVLLYRREHRIPSPLEVEQGRRLTDPELFRDELLGTWPGQE
jgi:hypothetical protein